VDLAVESPARDHPHLLPATMDPDGGDPLPLGDPALRPALVERVARAVDPAVESLARDLRVPAAGMVLTGLDPLCGTLDGLPMTPMARAARAVDPEVESPARVYLEVESQERVLPAAPTITTTLSGCPAQAPQVESQARADQRDPRDLASQARDPRVPAPAVVTGPGSADGPQVDGTAAQTGQAAAAPQVNQARAVEDPAVEDPAVESPARDHPHRHTMDGSEMVTLTTVLEEIKHTIHPTMLISP